MHTRGLPAVNIIAMTRFGVVILLLLACVKIIHPFIGALIWAVIIAISVWPAFQRLALWLGQRQRLAASLIVLIMLLALAAPIGLMILSLVETLPAMTSTLHNLNSYHLPQSPAWLTDIPLVGNNLQRGWQSTQSDLFGMLDKAKPMLNQAALWLLSHGAQLGMSLLEIVLAIICSGFLLLNGEAAQYTVKRALLKLGGTPALDLPTVVTRTIRSVMTGVVGTALIQTLLCVIGFVIVSMPAYLVLGLLCFIFAVAQLPTLLIWVPAAGWMFYNNNNTGNGIFLLVWGFLLVNSIDNFIKPLLISQGAKLPLSLIFLGVIGGLFAWGVIGLFIGPALLAISYTLFQYWLNDNNLFESDTPDKIET